MKKENVFLAACTQGAAPAMVERVICSTDEVAARGFLASAHPGESVISVVSLAQLEEQARRIRSVLKGDDRRWPVLVDPMLQKQGI